MAQREETHVVTTRDGWALSLVRRVGDRPPGPPVLFVPGYGMNAWIVQYHPHGPSFAEVLYDAGLDPGGSICAVPPPPGPYDPMRRP